MFAITSDRRVGTTGLPAECRNTGQHEAQCARTAVTVEAAGLDDLCGISDWLLFAFGTGPELHTRTESPGLKKRRSGSDASGYKWGYPNPAGKDPS